MKKAWKEKFMQGVFFTAACTSVLAVALICFFLFANGHDRIIFSCIGAFLMDKQSKEKDECESTRKRR